MNAKGSRKILDIFDKTIKKDRKQLNINTNSKQKIAEYKVSYSQNYEQVFSSAKFWRATLLKDTLNTSISDQRKLEQEAKQQVPDQKIKENIEIITSIEDCIDSIEEYSNLGLQKYMCIALVPLKWNLYENSEKKYYLIFKNKLKRAD